jgi:hypothetical protein
MLLSIRRRKAGRNSSRWWRNENDDVSGGVEPIIKCQEKSFTVDKVHG